MSQQQHPRLRAVPFPIFVETTIHEMHTAYPPYSNVNDEVEVVKAVRLEEEQDTVSSKRDSPP